MKESDIRPKQILDEYLRLSSEDAKQLIQQKPPFQTRNCPACGDKKRSIAFEKLGFEYARCRRCDTLFVAKVPAEEQLNKFYQTSMSAEYWSRVFLPSVADKRREVIIKPRAERVLKLAHSNLKRLATITDVGAGTGLFLTEVRSIFPEIELKAVEPGAAAAAICQESDLETYEGFAEQAILNSDWANQADLVTCFEVIEHVLDPRSFVNSLKSLARPGGLVLFTGLCGDGFDIKVLGKHSKAVSPPHHLNFLSCQGITELLLSLGLEELTVTTPGELDVDIVTNALRENKDISIGGFERAVALSEEDDLKTAFQTFLTENNLSSHIWVLSRRPF